MKAKKKEQHNWLLVVKHKKNKWNEREIHTCKKPDENLKRKNIEWSD